MVARVTAFEAEKQIRENLENSFYELLKKGRVGIRLVKEYPHQTSEELAEVMTRGFKDSPVGDCIRVLEGFDKARGYQVICETAFKSAMLRLIKEAIAGKDKTKAE